MGPNPAAAPPNYPGEPYEFSAEQNKVIGSLGNSMKWVALPAFVLGAMTLMYLIIATVWAFRTGTFTDGQVIALLVYLLVSFLLYFALGRWLMTASLGFRAVVETQGRDISFLMLALDNLRKLFDLLALFVKVFLVLAVIGLVLSVIGVYRSDRWREVGVPSVPLPGKTAEPSK
jgi:hypothetical protein